MPDFSKKVAAFFVRLAVDDKFAKAFAKNKSKAFAEAKLTPNERASVNQTARFSVDVNIETVSAGDAQQQTQTGRFSKAKKIG